MRFEPSNSIPILTLLPFLPQGVLPSDREGLGPRQFARRARVRPGQVRGQVGQGRGIESDHDDF